MSTIASFSGVLWLLLSAWAIEKMKVTHLHRRPLQQLRIRITQIIKSDWPAKRSLCRPIIVSRWITAVIRLV